jgi:antitoxin ChpS
MEFVTLRRAGGSLVLTIPKAFARALGLAQGERIGVKLDDGKLVVEPAVRERPRYSLEELLAQCDPAAPLTAEDEEWLGGGPIGNEQI